MTPVKNKQTHSTGGKLWPTRLCPHWDSFTIKCVEMFSLYAQNKCTSKVTVGLLTCLHQPILFSPLSEWVNQNHTTLTGVCPLSAINILPHPLFFHYYVTVCDIFKYDHWIQDCMFMELSNSSNYSIFTIKIHLLIIRLLPSLWKHLHSEFWDSAEALSNLNNYPNNVSWNSESHLNCLDLERHYNVECTTFELKH